MQLTEVQDQAIQAKMALIVGANTFDRMFAGVRFDEIDERYLVRLLQRRGHCGKDGRRVRAPHLDHCLENPGARDQYRDGLA